MLPQEGTGVGTLALLRLLTLPSLTWDSRRTCTPEFSATAWAWTMRLAGLQAAQAVLGSDSGTRGALHFSE